VVEAGVDDLAVPTRGLGAVALPPLKDHEPGRRGARRAATARPTTPAPTTVSGVSATTSGSPLDLLERLLAGIDADENDRNDARQEERHGEPVDDLVDRRAERQEDPTRTARGWTRPGPWP